MNWHDVRVGKPRRSLRLADESLPRLGLIGKVLGKDLDGHGPIQLDVAREVNDAHAAPSELALEGILSGKGRLQRDKVGRGECHNAVREGGSCCNDAQ